MQRLMDSAYRSSLEQYYRSVDISVHYANLHASIASINASLALGLFDVTDNAAKAELQAFAIRRDMIPDGHDNTSFDASVCIESHTFRAMDYITTSYDPNRSILTECSKSNASGSTSRQHILTCVLELSRPDILRDSGALCRSGILLRINIALVTCYGEQRISNCSLGYIDIES